MWSIKATSPYLKPARDLGSRCGAWVIDSWPPATTMSNSPALISWSASAMAVQPDRQTLLIVNAGNVHTDAGGDRGLPGRDLAGARGEHLTHDHVLHLVRPHPRPFRVPRRWRRRPVARRRSP